MDQNSKSPREPPNLSKMSLRVKSEHTDIRDEGNATRVESSLEIDGHRIEVSYEDGAGTSHLSQVSVLYTKINYENVSSDSLLHRDWAKNEESQVTVQLDGGEDETLGEQVNITPPAFPPIVLYSAPPLHGAPPTYSAIMRIGPVDVQPRRSFRIFGRRPEIQPSAPFIAPLPPPSYAEAHGFHVAAARAYIPGAQFDAEQFWGPASQPSICPACGQYVVTVVHRYRSAMTHVAAILLCLIGCWPCCIVPYFSNYCRIFYHECPLCSTIIDAQETGGTDPLAIICPYCNHYVITRTFVRCSAQTHFSAVILCLCGCWLCCFMPYCMKSCKTTYHECPLCSNTLGMQNPW